MLTNFLAAEQARPTWGSVEGVEVCHQVRRRLKKRFSRKTP
jgi:hypothetical protein